MFITEAFAQGAEVATTQGGSLSGTMAQLALIFIIFYFLLLRPQQKKIKQHEALLVAIKKGDKVITGGGLYATVLDASDPMDLTLEIANGVVVTANRSTIRDVIRPEMLEKGITEVKKEKAKKSSKPANSNKKDKK